MKHFLSENASCKNWEYSTDAVQKSVSVNSWHQEMKNTSKNGTDSREENFGFLEVN